MRRRSSGERVRRRPSVETNETARVIVASSPRDPHAEHVIRCLEHRGTPVVRLAGDNFTSCAPTWSPNSSLTFSYRGRRWSAGPSTTVWWRRPYLDARPGGETDEARLVREELSELFPGALAASGVSWVDAPWVLRRARLKLLQLAIATAVGARIPPTVVTADPGTAAGFASSGDVVAKAASTGIGIAPFVSKVPADELHRVAACPTTLQRPVRADADLRIVTVGTSAFTWRRARDKGGPVDWRAADPKGAGFAFSGCSTETLALTVAQRLGLSLSVQDWLATDEGDVFLEVNPQGQWLFLDRAAQILVPAVAELLEGAA